MVLLLYTYLMLKRVVLLIGKIILRYGYIICELLVLVLIWDDNSLFMFKDNSILQSLRWVQ